MNTYRLMNASAVALLIFSAVVGTARADPHHQGPNMVQATVFDHRYNHDHYYPARGYAVHQLPVGAYATHYRGAPYYYNHGAWYRPYGPHFVVVAPPIGIGLTVLPPFYTTVWFGGLPYYYANSAYYVWRPEQQLYQVTTPPDKPDSGTTTAPNSQDFFIYPKNGQSQQQQSADRYDCHSWAAQQTGFDPTQPLGGVSESQATSKRADYKRAETACLEARDYTVK